MEILMPTADESRAFFDTLVLAPKKPQISRFSSTQEDKVDDPDLLLGKDAPVGVAFADNLSDENSQAAMDSVAFAELYAEGNADLKNDPIGWHNKYALAMRNCGWYMPSYKYMEHVERRTNITMDVVVMDVIKAVAGRNAPAMLSLLGSAFDTMKSDGELVTLFDNNSKNGKSADFRILPCLQSAKGTAITSLLAMDCELSTQQGGAWFWKWNVSSIKMKKAAAMVELNMRLHERNREFIHEALDMDSEAFFKGAKLPKKA
ncbi:hypothetical protein SAMN04487857_106140 [Pseudomonas sp. ok272]|nr:hypothetical protein SAMN04487857_106140 [Pseudomonas sp. ok272]SFM75361.1 hypothetical protein SAMN04487858_10682 [Pseudomonas sp. ok602]